MPGAPFMQLSDGYVGNEPAANPAAAGSHTTFPIWLVVIGVVLPALILGGLRAGGFQFVFRRR